MAFNDVTVNLSQDKAAGSAGFGVPLVIQGMADAEIPYVECAGLAEVMDAGYGEGSAVYRQCMKIFMQDNRPRMVGVYAGTGKITQGLQLLGEESFRQVIPVFGESGDDTQKELASYIEATEDKMLFLSVPSVDALEGLGKLDRTVAIVYAGEDEGVEGAVVGATAGLAAGSFTYKDMIIKGIAPDKLTQAQLNGIHKAGGIAIVKKAGDIVTSEGFVLSGEYADVVDSRDYIIRNIAYKAQKKLNSALKLGFDNAGIGQLEVIVTGVLAEAYGMGMIAQTEDGDADYATDFDTREECPASDRAARSYNGGRFHFGLAGAIHYATINGVMNV